MLTRLIFTCALTLAAMVSTMAAAQDEEGYEAFRITDTGEAALVADAPKAAIAEPAPAAVERPSAAASPAPKQASTALPWVAASVAVALGLGGAALVRASQRTA